MSQGPEVIVVGLGTMGSAASAHLARAGANVTGLDAHEPPHDRGSAHGYTRVIRKAYFEHPAYVPWVERAYQLWDALAEATGRELLVQTGGLHIGAMRGQQVPGARRAANIHGLESEDLTAAQVRERFEPFRPTENMEAVLEPDAGFLRVGPCIRAHLERARCHGAELRTGVEVTGWGSHADGVRVQTSEGTLEADKLVLAAGPWLPELAPELPVELTVERQVQLLIEPAERPDAFEPGTFPVFTFEPLPGIVFYGVPLGDGRVKVAIHHGGERTTPETVDRSISPLDEWHVRTLLREYIPWLDGPIEEALVCLYTNTPDHHFVIDHHPDHPQVLVLSPCSGHGFKFAPAIGEAAQQLVTRGKTALDRGPFRIDRFT